ncbi:hypothetical protein M422DRAFT_267475 [Sphaerobolus stellatus SS14]|uniref:Uncharacterized protein n=1 Tax=Sphaerobolus stellatus (strain SS14) TaxID=990650 RepID=A0A0C9U930_SPHS4|nr:hypothetical protein M422DRAFT_267475 [Sphaerobolus stellatus SS14]
MYSYLRQGGLEQRGLQVPPQPPPTQLPRPPSTQPPRPPSTQLPQPSTTQPPGMPPMMVGNHYGMHQAPAFHSVPVQQHFMREGSVDMTMGEYGGHPTFPIVRERSVEPPQQLLMQPRYNGATQNTLFAQLEQMQAQLQAQMQVQMQAQMRALAAGLGVTSLPATGGNNHVMETNARGNGWLTGGSGLGGQAWLGSQTGFGGQGRNQRDNTLVIIGPRLLKSYKKSGQILKETRALLVTLESALGEEMVMKLREESQKEDASQYRPRLIEAPSRLEVLKKIQEEETAGNPVINRRTGTVRAACKMTGSIGINMALELVMRQQNLHAKLQLQNHPTLRQEVDTDESRRRLLKTLEEWSKTLKDFMPPEALQEESVMELLPEKEKLRVPSDYSQDSHERLGLMVLARTEYRLRVAQAYDALKKIREALDLKSFMVRQKHTNAGQAALLRSETAIERAQRQVDKWAEVYERAWDAMESLREGDTNQRHDNGRLKFLNRGRDLIILSKWLEEQKFWRERGEVAEATAARKGEGRQELSWIWKVEFQVGTAPDMIENAVQGLMAEAIRLEWLHAKAGYSGSKKK